MEIIGSKIQLLVTEEEADIILHSLARYDGPYHPDTINLTDAEKSRSQHMVQLAADMRDCIASELTRIYQEAEEIKFYQGR